jgi:hypothetical protein
MALFDLDKNNRKNETEKVTEHSDDDFLYEQSREACNGTHEHSVFDLVRSWATAAKRMFVSEIKELDKILIQGFLEYVTLKYPKIKIFDE